MRKELIVYRNPKSPNSEIFRTLRTNIQFMNTNKKLKTLLVTSTFPGEGKSWVTSNLAVSFAQAGKKVVLIDADMRKGRQYSIFGVSPNPGLSNYLAETEVYEDGTCSKSIGDYIQETEVNNLYVVSAGNVPPNPSELLVSAQMIKLLDELKGLCDLVIIDGTPCELVADSIILSRIVDSCVIIAAHKMTKKDALERVIKNIHNVGGKLAGVVLNRVPTSKRYNSRYYYYGQSLKPIDEKNSRFNFNNLLSKNSSKASKDSFEKDIAKYHKEMNEIEKNVNINYDNYKNEENVSNNANNQSVTNIANSFFDKDSNINNNDNAINNHFSNNDNNEQQSASATFLEKTNEIMKQINAYIDEEKKNLK